MNMKKFYIQVKSPEGIANFIIRHKKVTNENEAKNRVMESYKFKEENIISISASKPVFDSYYVQQSSSLDTYSMVHKGVHRTGSKGAYIGQI
jgi:hypothetical protein